MVLFDERIIRSAVGSKMVYSRDVCRHVQCIADTRSQSPRAMMWHSGPGEMIVAFRGTVGLRDIADTLDSRVTVYGFCGTHVRVHAGMLAAFSEMEGGITASIVKDACRYHIPTSLTFTGHSKGGCHAQFAAAYYSSMLAGNCRVTCHTFGAPTTGDCAFAEWYSGSVHDSVILIDRDDPIAKLPPAFTGYCAAALAGTVVLQRGSRKSWNPLASHDMDSYLEKTLAMFQSTL